jgi:hypothetical protein
MNNVILNKSKIDKLIEEIELDLIKFTGGSLEERKKSLPLKGEREIKSLIWNLLTSEKWRNQISYSDYSKILDIWFSRLN